MVFNWSDRAIQSLFAGTAFLGAALMFILEPAVGKAMLPGYGGTPAVWNTCVFFFQGVLLLGYLLAHFTQRRLRPSGQLATQLILAMLALVMLPIHFDELAPDGLVHPVLSVITTLVRSVGPLFLLLSTTSLVTQSWFATFRTGMNPYWLAAASNAGSLVGLLAYPTLIEPQFSLTQQFWFIGSGTLLLTVLFATCGGLAVLSSKHASGPIKELSAVEPTAAIVNRPVTHVDRWGWFWLAACPSSMMLGVTTFLSSEIAPMPVLWLLPLGVYLASFIIAFANPPKRLLTACGVVFFLLAAAALPLRHFVERADLAGVLTHNAVLLVASIALHGKLATTRPGPTHLTEFYLWMSCGGLFGSAFNTFVAPVAFSWSAEYPLALVLGIFLIPWPTIRSLPPPLWITLPSRVAIAALVLIAMAWNIYFSSTARYVQFRSRSFFGEFRVEIGRLGKTRQLVHGTTVHGLQFTDPQLRGLPLGYYFPTSPIGQLFRDQRGTETTRTVGIIGLGIGSLASYAEPGQEHIYYEIDPLIAEVARNPGYFNFLRDAERRGANLSVVIGDARIRLRQEPDGRFGMLVLDAFSSDAIPTHLLTREAIVEYRQKLRPGGLLAFHISNNYVDLELVLANAARDLGMVPLINRDIMISGDEQARGKRASVWLVMVDADASPPQLRVSDGWQACVDHPEDGFWTDESSCLLRIIMRRKPALLNR